MRTMKRVAAVALSVVVLMTSGVSAKAAVTDVQPAKSKEEAVEKWTNKIVPSGQWDTLSDIKVVGNYIYAADDSQHRVVKLDKKTGNIVKEHKYSNEEYTQYSASYIGYGDGKVYVEYNGRIEAFDETTLEPVWISEELSHEETNSETGKTTTVDDTIASRLFYDDGHLYFGTGKNSGSGKYYVIDTKSEKKEDATKTEEIKNVKEIIS